MTLSAYTLANFAGDVMDWGDVPDMFAVAAFYPPGFVYDSSMVTVADLIAASVSQGQVTLGEFVLTARSISGSNALCTGTVLAGVNTGTIGQIIVANLPAATTGDPTTGRVIGQITLTTPIDAVTDDPLTISWPGNVVFDVPGDMTQPTILGATGGGGGGGWSPSFGINFSGSEPFPLPEAAEGQFLSADGHTIVSYDWDWGDGGTHGTDAESFHTYTVAGYYTITLTVTDSLGSTGSGSSGPFQFGTPTYPPPGGFVTPYVSPWQTDVYEADNVTFVRRLLTASGRTWTDEENLSTGGSGVVTVPLTAVDDVAALMVRGRMVRHLINETARWTGVVRPWDKDAISTDGEGSEKLTIDMLGHLSEWSRSIIDIPPGSDLFLGVTNRMYGWMSIESVDDPTGSVITAATLVDPRPRAWWDPFSSKYQMTTQRYAQRRFTIGSQIVFVPYLSSESQFNVYINGVALGSGEPVPGTSSDKTYRGGVELGPGEHIIAVEVTSLPGTSGQFSCSCSTADPDAIHGRLNRGTFLFHTGENPDTDLNDPWGVSATPMGPTPGRMIRSMLEEAQARGRLLDWTLSFTDDADTDGQPWAVRINELSIAVGTHYDAVFDQLTALYCDIGTTPTTKVLDSWNWHTRGNFDTDAAGVEITGAQYGVSATDGRQPNLQSLSLSVQDQPTPTRLRVITATETFWYGDEGGEEDVLSITDYTDHDTAVAYAAAQIAMNQQLGLEIAASSVLRPTNDDDTPYAGFGIGDAVRHAMDGNAVERVKVKGIICNESTDGLHRPLWTPEVNALTVEEEEQTARAIARLTPAGLKNAFLPASAGASSFGTGTAFGVLDEVQAPLFSNNDITPGAVSSPFTFDTPSRIYWYDWGLAQAASDDLLIGVYLAGNTDLSNLSTLIAAFTIPAGSGVVGFLPGLGQHYTNQVVEAGGFAQATIISGGTGGNGLTVNIYATAQI